MCFGLMQVDCGNETTDILAMLINFTASNDSDLTVIVELFGIIPHVIEGVLSERCAKVC